MPVQQIKQNKIFAYWFFACSFMVFVMIVIGGLTRLTNSGLSMVEWKPITGLLPPLNAHDWGLEFAKYQTSPEFLKINKFMSLDEFKSIYWFEFIHRMAGRLTALILLLPFLFFWASKKLSKRETLEILGICFLVGLQGFLGWFMVKSGLVDHPDVSPFRLAIHLIVAFIIIALIFHKGLKFLHGDDFKNNNKKIENFCNITILLLFLQSFLGGMTAGLNAGLIYNEFPLMGGSFVPAEIWRTNSLFLEPAFIQFAHRIFAMILFIFVVRLVWKIWRKMRITAIFITCAIFVQFSLGILTLINNVPISLASLHQIGAAILLLCLIQCRFLLKLSR